MRLSSDDLALSAAGCRMLAQHYRDTATRYADGIVKISTLQRAHHAERLAEFFELERERVQWSVRHDKRVAHASHGMTTPDPSNVTSENSESDHTS